MAATVNIDSPQKLAPSVHFQPTVQEISPATPLTATPDDDGNVEEHVTQDELRALTSSFRTAHLQGLRIASFSYEPVSLPASRTASHDEASFHHASRQHTPNSTVGSHSPMLVAKAHEVQSPPLTPLASSHADVRISSETTSPVHSRHGTMTPQETVRESSPLRARIDSLRPSASDDITNHPMSPPPGHHGHYNNHHDIPLGNHRQGMFSLGPSTSAGGSAGSGSVGGSVGGSPGGPGGPDVSRESSASEKSASQFYTRPLTPSGDANDPYAANKRPPQNKIEPRFVFSRLGRKKEGFSPTTSSMNSPKHKDDKRHSSFLGGHHHRRTDKEKEEAAAVSATGSGGDENSVHSRQASMSDLKRFFKLGPSHHHKIRRAVSPAVSIRSARNDSTVVKASAQIPFGDEHTLTSKYGKLGKVLGSGAGGSVRLMKRSEDSTVFAVKEFRARHTYESEKEYAKKLTAEYCIGSSLHHGNIIETLDIINEKGKWYEVMEYAPYDLFAIVMTGRMTRPEVACCFLQILSGVTYLHSMGLAHRDLKLDNVVVSEHGIMKIIDFGSAHVFQYPFENGIVLASGIVGSDPYLAPEVYDERKYDPTAVDIWSLAIIFCCMTLRRFPWKVPRVTDNSYKLFAAEPNTGTFGAKAGERKDDKDSKEHEKEKSADPVKSADKSVDKLVDKSVDKSGEKSGEKSGDKSGEKSDDKSGDKLTEKPEKAEKSDRADKSDRPAEKKEVIKGPWRILRLLPRESRHVIGGMLKIDPAERINMRDILKDPWVANTIICRQTGPGRVFRANTHTHVLEAPATPMKAA